MFFKRKKITSFETLVFCERGMRHLKYVKAQCFGEDAEISYYPSLYPHDGEQPKILIKCPAEKVLNILNKYGVLSWDGFDGKRPRGVLDGKTFRLDATVNGGREIEARGDQRFPKNYSEFTHELNKLLGLI